MQGAAVIAILLLLAVLWAWTAVRNRPPSRSGVLMYGFVPAACIGLWFLIFSAWIAWVRGAGNAAQGSFGSFAVLSILMVFSLIACVALMAGTMIDLWRRNAQNGGSRPKD